MNSMSETGNSNQKPSLGDELNKEFKMGVGAVAGAVEKDMGFVHELTTEGTETNKRAAQMGGISPARAARRWTRPARWAISSRTG